jgi:hypothetical protein
MKRWAAVLLCTFLLVGGAAAQTLSEEDREFGAKHLEQTRDAIVEATNGLTEAQWRFKPAPERWSVAECLEHIAVVEDFLFEMVTDQVIKSPAGPGVEGDPKETDKLVLAKVSDRSQRFQAPEPVRPQDRWATPEETLEHFLESRARTLDYMKDTPDLRAHAMDSPLGRPLDAYQWLLYISAHSERHTKQIQEVMTNANFPSK